MLVKKSKSIPSQVLSDLSVWAKSDGRDSLLGIKRGGNCQKHKKNMFFEQIAFLKTICLNHKRITDVALFKKEIESDSIMVALLSRATRAIWSRLLFFKERGERIAYSRSIIWAILSKKAKAQILNLAFYSILLFNQIFVIGYISNSSEGCRCTLQKCYTAAAVPLCIGLMFSYSVLTYCNVFELYYWPKVFSVLTVYI